MGAIIPPSPTLLFAGLALACRVRPSGSGAPRRAASSESREETRRKCAPICSPPPRPCVRGGSHAARSACMGRRAVHAACVRAWRDVWRLARPRRALHSTTQRRAHDWRGRGIPGFSAARPRPGSAAFNGVSGWYWWWRTARVGGRRPPCLARPGGSRLAAGQGAKLGGQCPGRRGRGRAGPRESDGRGARGARDRAVVGA